VDENNQPVPGARISAVRASAPGNAPVQSLAGADGGFAINAASPGTYTLCVQTPGADFLNPCDWETQMPSATVAAGQQTAPITIRLKRGARVRVRIDDPAQALLQETLGTGVHLLVGVWTTKKTFLPAAIATRDSQGREYSTVVPFDATTSLTVTPARLALADAAGKALPTQPAPIPITVTRGTTPNILRFQVKGVLP
jgi:hypothetical protein